MRKRLAKKENESGETIMTKKSEQWKKKEKEKEKRNRERKRGNEKERDID